ncbi:MAG: hypothetical protein R3B81_01110 [bacterium]
MIPRMFAPLALGLLLLAPAAVPATEAEGDSGVAREDLDPGVSRADLPEATGGPLAVFAEVERAWVDGDVDGLVALLDPEEKVSLSFSRSGPRGGWFNGDQAYYLLKDMFEFSQTEFFEFRRYYNLDSAGRSPYAVAGRSFRLNGAPHEDQVYISLRRRGDHWYVGEIRSIDR